MEGSGPKSLPSPSQGLVPGSPPEWAVSGRAVQQGAEGVHIDGKAGTTPRAASDRDLPMASRTPRRAAGAAGAGGHPGAGVPASAAGQTFRPASRLSPSLPACPPCRAAAATSAGPGPPCLEAGQRGTQTAPACPRPAAGPGLLCLEAGRRGTQTAPACPRPAAALIILPRSWTEPSQ